MKIRKLMLLSIAALATISCGGGSSGSSNVNPTPSPVPSPLPVGNNYIQLNISPNAAGSVCSNFNIPCVAVTICSTTNPTQCTTVDNILLDTGSTGLRIFSSFLSDNNVSLTQVPTQDSGGLAECVYYGDGSANWGPVSYANLALNGVTVINIPIQQIDSNYASLPGSCGSAVSSPSDFGINGILGVSPLTHDNVGTYYSCSGSSCSQISESANQQLLNPISAMSTNNNGLVLEFPALNSSGTSSAIGYAIFGIGTESNNIPASGVEPYPISNGDQFSTVITTTYNGTPYPSFLDTGSNLLYFLDDNIMICADASSIYCPASSLNLSATNSSTNGSSSTINFSIGNFDNLINSGNTAFNNVGASSGGSFFDWGLPFFFGRTVYIGFSGSSSSLGTGPYWAY